MTVSDEKLEELDQALAELGRSEEDISAVRDRFEGTTPADLAAVDGELESLAEGVSVDAAFVAPAEEATQVSDLPPDAVVDAAADAWDGEQTEVEIMDMADDFVLLVDEGELEELEKVGEEAAKPSLPPPIPNAEPDEDEEDEGFFKKLFGSRRSSNRP